MRIGRPCEHAEPRLGGPLRLLALVAVLSLSPFAAAAGPPTGKLVVVLYPQNNDGSPGHALVDQGIRSTLATGVPGPIRVYSEYLDIAQPRAANDWHFQTQYLRRVCGPESRSGHRRAFLRPGFCAEVPRARSFPVFPSSSVPSISGKSRPATLPPDVVGVPMTVDMAATLDLALRLHPNTRRVFVVAGRSKIDAAGRRRRGERSAATKDRWSSFT